MSAKIDVVIGITSVVKEIVEYAEKKKIDMIVIGSRGMTGFKKLLLGSVARWSSNIFTLSCISSKMIMGSVIPLE